MRTRAIAFHEVRRVAGIGIEEAGAKCLVNLVRRLRNARADCRGDAPVPDYPNQHPAVTHLALVSKDVEADVARLEKAGGKLWGKIDYQSGGDVLAFVQDPWGFTLQLVKRAQAMV